METRRLSMSDFEIYQENTEFNNRIIQYALREIDTKVLAIALSPLSEDTCQIVYRNMTSRAVSLVIQEIEELGKIPEKSVKYAQAHFLKKLKKFHAFQIENDQNVIDELPQLKTDNEETIINTFVTLQRYIRKHNYLDIEKCIEENTHPLLKKGLELFLDGWEPLLSQSILERYRTAYIEKIERETMMILEGMNSLFAKDLPQVIEEKLGAFNV
jgi:hypothetical protein